MKKDLEKILQERIMVLDGAMGTMIQGYPLEEEDFRGEKFKDINYDMKGNNDILSITRPDVIKEIYQQYLEAGSDIIETNSFSSTSIAQADYNCQDPETIKELNLASAKVAREAADEFTERNPDKPRFVAGVLGPTNKTASISPDVNDPGYREVSFDDLAKSYKEQATHLIDGKVDLLLVETVFDTLNAKSALYAIDELKEEKGVDIPIMVSGTITDASGRTLTGQTTEAFYYSIFHGNLFSVGLNCALGAKDLRPYIKQLHEAADCYVSAHPNAGLPNEFGEYDQTPDQMAAEVEEFLKDGFLNILGGCCGTKPEHTAKIAETAAKYSPRKLPSMETETA